MSKKKTTPAQHGSDQTPIIVPETSKPVRSAVPANTTFFEKTWLLLGILAIAAAIIYVPSFSNGFLFFDDDTTITRNDFVKNADIKALLTTQMVGMYVPVSALVWTLIYQVAGEHASAFHVVSLLLHILATCLAFVFLKKIQARRDLAFFGALIFAVHPLKVEPVAWVAAMSTLMFSLFYLAALIFWVKYRGKEQDKAENPESQAKINSKYYYWTLLAFALSALSKSAGVTLPLTLIALDWYWGWPSENGQTRPTLLQGLMGAVKKLTPFFLISLALGFYTFITRNQEGHTVAAVAAYTMGDRFFMVCHTILFYFYKLLAPINLSIVYPMTKVNGHWSPDFLLAPLGILAIGWGIFRLNSHNREYGLAALLFLLPLCIMLPLFSIGNFEMCNDRYMYLPSIGFFYILFLFSEKINAPVRWVLWSFIAGVYAFLAFQQTKNWQNDRTLFKKCVDQYPDATICNCNLAYGELLTHEFENCVKHYTTTLKQDPTYYEAYNGRGQAYMELRKYAEALSDFENAIKAGISTHKLFLNRGKCLVILNRPAEAIAPLQQSIEIEPGNPETYYFKALAEGKTNDVIHSLEDYSKAIELKPRYIEALVNRGLIYTGSMRFEEAIADYTQALNVNPNVALALNNRAYAYLNQGQLNKALEDVEKALKVQPDYQKAAETKAMILAKMGAK